MNSKLFFSLLLCLLPVFRAAAQLYDDPRLLSFEKSGDVKAWQTNNATVKWSDAHYKNGTHAMEWTFKPGATLSLKQDLRFEPHVKGDRDNYLSAFIVWVYNETPMKDKHIRFSFLKDGKTCTSFPFGLDFKGWRGAWVCYERDMEGHPLTGMNELRISAPDTKGRLFFDHIIVTTQPF